MSTCKYKTIVLYIILSTMLHANEESNCTQEMVGLLEEVSTYAIDEKVNINDLPSTVEVMRQQELVELGINTIAEALTLLSGVEISLNSTGQPIVVIRGIKSPETFTLDKIKLMVDGVDIISSHYGTIEYYLNFPIDLVSRIEILKSPGSAMYGTDAFLGVINIVTHNSRNRQKHLSVGAGSYGYIYGGFNTFIKEEDYSIAIDGYYQKNNKYIDATGFVAYPERFEREETSDERMRDYSLGLHAKYKNLTLKTRFKSSKDGVYYNIRETLSNGNNGENKTREYFFSEVSYKENIWKKSAITLFGGYSFYDGKYIISEQMSDEVFAEYNAVIPEFGSDLYANSHLKEQSYYAKLELDYKELENNTITFGASHKQTKNIINRYFSEPFTKEKYAIFSPYYPDYYLIDGGYYNQDSLSRELSALYFQDLVEVRDNIDIQLGFRLDYYKDELTQPSYKIGLVYKHSDSMNSKFSYSTGFRAPSWSELYREEYTLNLGNPNLHAESIETYEYNYIYKTSLYDALHVNVYYSNLNNTIDRAEEKSSYLNSVPYSSKGIELSYKVQLFINDIFVLNYAYNDTQYYSNDRTYQQQTPEVAQHLGNIYYIHHHNKNLAFSARYRYVGEREKNKLGLNSDERALYEKNYPANHRVDTTLSYFYEEKFQLNFTIKNLLNSKIINHSYQNIHPDGLVREGRNYALKASLFF